MIVPQQAMKGQGIVDFLANHHVPENSKLYEVIPDEAMAVNTTLQDEIWQMFFDGTLRMGPKGKFINGLGIGFISTEIFYLMRIPW